MIYNTFEYLDRYAESGSLLRKGLEFARDFDSSKPDGDYQIEGDRLYAMVKSYTTEPRESLKFESHKKYIDIQVLIDGEELIDVALEKNLEVAQDYSEEKDAAFYKEPHQYTSVVMKPGRFGVLYPEDVHRPNCSLQNDKMARKIVVKVHV